jgi:methionine-rich copper-binding protein CopC
MRPLSFFVLFAACCALVLPVGCGDDEEKPDAGPSPVDAGPDAGPPDAGPSDRVPPRVVAHTPANNAGSVPVGSTLELTFSEPMQFDVGTVQLLPSTDLQNNGVLNARPQHWDATRTKVTFQFPPPGLPRGRKLIANVAKFTDQSGNVMDGVYSFTFTVEIGPPPQVASTTPVEGASEVPLNTPEIVITFNDTMDTTVGTLVAGGGLPLGPATWTNNRTLKVPLTSELVYDRNYSVRLDGFRNYLGLPLNGQPTLGDGKLDFGTGVDDDPPRVVSSSPAEGATGLQHEDISFIVFTFSEPMDPTFARAEVVDVNNTRTVLVGQWSADGFTVTYDALFKLRPNANLRVDLNGFRDKVGNPLDLVTAPAYLGTNGDLDISMAPDTIKPHVISSSIPEASSNVYPVEVFNDNGTVGYRKVFSFRFNEPMQIENPLVSLHETGNPNVFRSFPGNWSSDRRTLTVTIRPPAAGQLPLRSDEEYFLNLTNLRDASGNTLDPTLPPLDDGRFDFRTLLHDIDLTHACEHAVIQVARRVNATATVNAQTPRVDQLHTRFELVLPGSDGSFQGFVRAQLALNRFQPIFTDHLVPLRVIDPTDPNLGVGVITESVPFACVGITHLVKFGTTLSPELHLQYGPVNVPSFHLIMEETL